MCHHCNYEQLLGSASLDPTENRLRVLEVVGNNTYPLSAGDIFEILQRTCSINKVTVYRILDLLVAKGIVDRLSTGGRASYYGIAPNDYHLPHPHFYCTHCGRMDCLSPESIQVDTDPLWKTFPGRIERVQVRVDGICRQCARQDSPSRNGQG